MRLINDVPDGQGFVALIFDWDGTLVDSREVCFQALSRAMADTGTALDPAWYWPRQAIASPDMLVLWEQQFGVLPEAVDRIVGRCRQYVIEASVDLKTIAPVAAVARKARVRGQKVAVGSNASADTVAAGLKATELGTFMDAVVTWSDVPAGRGKPAPDIFLLAAEKVGVDPARCLVYEDSEAGVAAALSAGMTVYNVRTGVLNTA